MLASASCDGNPMIIESRSSACWRISDGRYRYTRGSSSRDKVPCLGAALPVGLWQIYMVWASSNDPSYGGRVVAFFVGLALFIGVCGWLDTRLPWPRRPIRGRR
jgi:hypothetical protein